MHEGLARLAELCKKNNVGILYAFGSRGNEAREALEGRGMELNASAPDLDIGVHVITARRMTVREKASLAVDLEDLFEAPRVDLVLLNEADPFLAANIIRGERLYCVDPHDADEYELYVLRRAGDLAPLERERLSLLERS